MEHDVTVKVHHVDDEKGKYTVVLKGITVDLVEIELRLKANSDVLLAQFPRHQRFSLKMGDASQKTLK
jgi:hypothetical protein